jgi:hypothetical protein
LFLSKNWPENGTFLTRIMSSRSQNFIVLKKI